MTAVYWNWKNDTPIIVYQLLRYFIGLEQVNNHCYPKAIEFV
jgi:hypothetical protein